MTCDIPRCDKVLLDHMFHIIRRISHFLDRTLKFSQGKRNFLSHNDSFRLRLLHSTLSSLLLGTFPSSFCLCFGLPSTSSSCFIDMNPTLPLYNNVPFSSSRALCKLPSAKADLDEFFNPPDRLLPSFFDDPAFASPLTYQPPADFQFRSRRTAGNEPSHVYPRMLAAWYYPASDCLPVVYEDARDLYFCLRFPFIALSNMFLGAHSIPESHRSNHIFALLMTFKLHLVRLLSPSSSSLTSLL